PFSFFCELPAWGWFRFRYIIGDSCKKSNSFWFPPGAYFPPSFLIRQTDGRLLHALLRSSSVLDALSCTIPCKIRSGFGKGSPEAYPEDWGSRCPLALSFYKSSSSDQKWNQSKYV